MGDHDRHVKTLRAIRAFLDKFKDADTRPFYEDIVEKGFTDRESLTAVLVLLTRDELVSVAADMGVSRAYSRGDEELKRLVGEGRFGLWAKVAGFLTVAGVVPMAALLLCIGMLATNGAVGIALGFGVGSVALGAAGISASMVVLACLVVARAVSSRSKYVAWVWNRYDSRMAAIMRKIVNDREDLRRGPNAVPPGEREGFDIEGSEGPTELGGSPIHIASMESARAAMYSIDRAIDVLEMQEAVDGIRTEAFRAARPVGTEFSRREIPRVPPQRETVPVPNGSFVRRTTAGSVPAEAFSETFRRPTSRTRAGGSSSRTTWSP